MKQQHGGNNYQQEHRIPGANARLRVQFNFCLEVTVTLTFDLVTQNECGTHQHMQLHMKFQSCRWKHFDFLALLPKAEELMGGHGVCVLDVVLFIP